MVILSSFTNVSITLAMYNDTLTLALLLRSATSLSICFFVMSFYISDSFLKLTVWLV
jgi:hypothetical protein